MKTINFIMAEMKNACLERVRPSFARFMATQPGFVSVSLHKS